MLEVADRAMACEIDDNSDWNARIGRRSERRTPIDTEISVVIGDISHLAVVTDLSPSGAQLLVRQAMALDDLVIIRHHLFQRQAVVRWATHHRCGVRFDHALGEPEYLALLRNLGALP
jgi:hypothetical protein